MSSSARCSQPAAAAIQYWKKTLFIQDPLSKSVKFRVLLIKMCPFCFLCLIMKKIYCNFLVCCKMLPHTFWFNSWRLDTLMLSCWENKEDEGKLQKKGGQVSRNNGLLWFLIPECKDANPTLSLQDQELDLPTSYQVFTLIMAQVQLEHIQLV